jgi:hypothetical protein
MTASRACVTCGRATPDLEVVASDRCLVCWSVERKLAIYLAFGGKRAHAFVSQALDAASPCEIDELAPRKAKSTPELPPPPPSSNELAATEEASTGIRRMEIFK